MRGLIRSRFLWTLVLFCISRSLSAAAEHKTPIWELRSTISDATATVAQKIKACDELAAMGADAPTAVPTLMEALPRRGELHRHVIAALHAIGEPAVDALVHALSDADPLERSAAADALVDMRDLRAGNGART